MARIKVAIACQGGGSQTAFTAGAIKGLLEAGAAQDFEAVSVSGTSGGAVCAALAWHALRKGEQPLRGQMIDFWRDNIAHGWNESASMSSSSTRCGSRTGAPFLSFSLPPLHSSFRP